MDFESYVLAKDVSLCGQKEDCNFVFLKNCVCGRPRTKGGGLCVVWGITELLAIRTEIATMADISFGFFRAAYAVCRQ